MNHFTEFIKTKKQSILFFNKNDTVGFITPYFTVGFITPYFTVGFITPYFTVGFIAHYFTVGFITPYLTRFMQHGKNVSLENEKMSPFFPENEKKKCTLFSLKRCCLFLLKYGLFIESHCGQVRRFKTRSIKRR